MNKYKQAELNRSLLQDLYKYDEIYALAKTKKKEQFYLTYIFSIFEEFCFYYENNLFNKKYITLWRDEIEGYYKIMHKDKRAMLFNSSFKRVYYKFIKVE